MTSDKLFIGTDRRPSRHPQYVDQQALNIHVHILGSSGMGKSWLMKHMIKTDIDRNIHGDGPGLCLIDPDGDVFDYALAYAALNPLARHRLLVIDTLRPEWAIGLNYLEYDAKRMSSASHAGVVIRGIAKAFGDEDAETMPRLLRWERDALIPLIEAGLTLGELNRFLNDDTFRKLVLAKLPPDKLSTRPLNEEWQFYGQTSFRDRLTLAESVLNRASKFAVSDYALSVFGQSQSTIDFRKAMDRRKIILCRLATGKFSPEEIRLMGIVIVDKIVQAGLSRVDLPEAERVPFRFYIDEFAQFVCEDIADGLDRLRKYKVSMVLAHQRLQQLKNESLNVYSAVMSNANVKIAFATSREDAEIMAEEMFGGQLYRNKVKRVIEQTKFWPLEEEREVRTSGVSRTEMWSTSEMTSESRASSAALSSMETSGMSVMSPMETNIFGPDMMTPAMQTVSATSGSSQLSASMTGQSVGHGTTQGDAWTESASKAVIPFYNLQPFKEVSSVQDWTIQEKLERFVAWITNQDPRMAQVKIGRNGRPFPVLTPDVLDPGTVPSLKGVAIQQAYERNQSGMPMKEVERQIKERWRQWDEAVRAYQQQSEEPPEVITVE